MADKKTEYTDNAERVEWTILAYNILRMIGQESIGRRVQPPSIRSDAGDCAR